MSLLLVAAPLATAACTFRATVSDLDGAVTAAEGAWTSLDVKEFERASTELDFVLPCLVEPVPPPLAARLHRLRALGRFADGDPDGAKAALLGSRALEPDYVFPEEVLPTGYELRTLYEGLSAPDPGGSRVPRPRDGALVLDGTEGRVRPNDRPVLFQRLEDAAVADTRYLDPGEPLPPYPGVNRRRTALLVAAAGAGAGAAAFYGLAALTEASLRTPDPGWTEDDLQSIRGRNHAYLGVSAGLGGVALVGVGTAVLWGRP